MWSVAQYGGRVRDGGKVNEERAGLPTNKSSAVITPAEMQRATEQFRATLEKLAPVWVSFQAVMEIWAKQIADYFEPIIRELARIQIRDRRRMLYVNLSRRGVPGELAWWLSQHCPERWLPELTDDTGDDA